jgi:hypothetical protein
MRRFTTMVLVAAVMLSMFVVPASAHRGAGRHPGCTGIERALTKAAAEAMPALLVVAEKLGCVVHTGPVDAVACPDGTASLARFTYEGTLGEPYEHGYPTWTGSWTSTGGDGASIPHGDGGGFYWDEAVPGSVLAIVLASMTGEVVTLTAAEHRSPPGGHAGVVSQNEFADRTGIGEINFCG